MPYIHEGTWASVLYLYLKQNMGVNNMCILLAGMRCPGLHCWGEGGGLGLGLRLGNKEIIKGNQRHYYVSL